MCTSIGMKTADFYFGRNMDLEYEFGEHVVITPRNYPFNFRKAGEMKCHYAIIGMASVVENYPLYADAGNEYGLCMAGLNFPDNAYYPSEESSVKYNVSPFEIIPFVLGKCKNVEEARKLLLNTQLVDIPFSKDIPVATLHWHIADKNSSIVLESTKDGMKIYDDPVNVLTNNPTFDFHITNLAHYQNLTVGFPENCLSKYDEIQSFGKGLGSFGLPGDFSPTSRFVKSAYLLMNSVCAEDEESSVSQFFHLLDSVAVVRGSIDLQNKLSYCTTYSSCINADKGIYYYKTYSNNSLTAVNMNNENLDDCCLKEFQLAKSQAVTWAN